MGLMHGWIQCLDAVIQMMGEMDVFLICVSAVLSVMIGGVMSGALNDALHKQSKVLMCCLLMISGISLSLFSMMITAEKCGIIEMDYNWKIAAICCCVVGIFLNAGTYGIAYEALVELIYPLREIYAGCMMCIYVNVWSAVYVLLRVYLSEVYLNWIVAGMQIIAAMLLLGYEQEYKRLDIDYNAERIKVLIRTPRSNVLGHNKSVNDYRNMTVSASQFLFESNLSKSQMHKGIDELT